MLKLRPFQEEALQALDVPLSQQRHVVCVAPTGSGKSLVYERAASGENRRTLLITPLVALARQQFEKLRTLGIPVSLGAGGSGQKPPLTESGAWIISPEILSFQSSLSHLQRWKPNLLVVDECHCLWEWGENFRPAFSLIPNLIKTYQIPHSLWLTATLPFDARVHLRDALPQEITEIGRFDLPPSLQLLIQHAPWESRTEILLRWLGNIEGSGIIFVATREATLRISRLIEATGKKVIAYHGGMSSEERKNIETMVSLKIPDVIVATSAFGMGMDYSHLTYVVLWQAPTSLLSLVQTMGRVGRNENSLGKALVLWDKEDFRLLEWTIQNSKKRREELLDLLRFLTFPECRRIALKRYFDRNHNDNFTTQLTCNLCDFCLKDR